MNIPAAAAAAARISSCYTLPLVSRSRSRYIASAIPATAFFRNPIQTRIMTALESCCVDEDFGAIRFAVEDSVEEAVDALRDGKVIALPTDTLYGFACDACSSEAVSRIYEIKGRKHTILLAICVGDVSDIERFAVTEHLPSGLLDSLLPGPVTLILSRGASSVLDKSLNPGLDSIGVRVPDYDFIRAIARGLGRAIALTSANLSGQPSSVCIKDFQNLWQQCAYVYDDGVLPSGRAGSTIVDLSRVGKYRIVRPGSAGVLQCKGRDSWNHGEALVRGGCRKLVKLQTITACISMGMIKDSLTLTRRKIGALSVKLCPEEMAELEAVASINEG
ncbi:Threonylcarbamoyl-AMP synthase [Linum perenne]